MKQIKIDKFGIEITLDDNGGGNIISGLERDNEHSVYEHVEDEIAREKYNGALDAIESLILAHACSGIDVTTKAYIDGIKTTLESCCNNF